MSVLGSQVFGEASAKSCVGFFEQKQCKHPAHSPVVGCKLGGGLPMVTALTGMSIICLFVVFMVIPELLRKVDVLPMVVPVTVGWI